MQKNNKLFSTAVAGIVLGCSLITVNASAGGKDKNKAKNPTPSEDTATAVAVSPVKEGFTRLPSGLEYKFLYDAAGPNANVGHFIEMHIETSYNDSVIFSSRKMNGDQPVPYQVQRPAFTGDLAEGFTLLSAGDSALFLVPVDSMVAAGAQLPPMIEGGKGNKLEYKVTLVTARTPQQMQQEMQAAEKKQTTVDQAILTSYFAKNKMQPYRTASGLYYTISKMGFGEKPVAGDKVSMNYTGTILNGNTFDSNVDPQFHHVEPFQFVLGQHQVIAGWDEGIALLPKGTKATLYIPSAMGYGSRSPGPQIPANSILVFDVEVVDITKQ